MTFDFSSPETQGEVLREAVKVVKSKDPNELEEEGSPCVEPKGKDDLRTGNIANLELEESFVYKHGVLESWHLIGKKLRVEPPDPSTSKELNQVASIDPGGEAKKLPFPKAVRRGRTPFDWEAFHAEMKEREKSVEDPP